ncbi:hypothetical protein GmHk_16G046232 [Glycine max]|nr:hypothetical protein GmHk_16G046232 [Glycine max]
MATAAAVSLAAEADPTLLATTHHPPPNAVGQERSTLGHNSNPYLGYNRVAYPYGLPPNFMPPFMHDDTGHVTSPILEGEPPRQLDEVHEDHREYAQRDVDFYPSIPYAQHHSSFSARTGNSSNPATAQPRAPTPIQRKAPQALAPTTTRSAGNAHFGAGSNAMRNFPLKPIPEFTPIPMTYEDLLPSLIANQMTVITPGKIYQHPFPKWYDPDATCTYHGKTPGHSTEKCMALKYKVQHLIDVGWLTFQEDRPNVKTNPLANHGGGAVNAIESDRPRRSKPLKDVATPKRFIYEAFQKGGVIPHGGHEEDSCLLHPDELHDMETCLAVEELLQRMIDQGRLELHKSPDTPRQLNLFLSHTKTAMQSRGAVMVARVMLGNGYEPGMGLGKDNGGRTSLISARRNRGKFGLGYKPTQADIRKSIAGRKSGGQGSRLGQEVEGGPPCHISRIFISAGLGHEGQVVAICKDDSPSGSDLVQPCPPGFRLGNWRVEERSDIYATSIM